MKEKQIKEGDLADDWLRLHPRGAAHGLTPRCGRHGVRTECSCESFSLSCRKPGSSVSHLASKHLPCTLRRGSHAPLIPMVVVCVGVLIYAWLAGFVVPFDYVKSLQLTTA